MHKIIFALLLSFTFNARALTSAQYLKRPKLVVVVVIDQFRSDLLTRFEKNFLSAGTAAKPGGFRFLMEQGAWFPFAEYSALQDMTCPGHATILTGSNPASHGIGVNEWFDPKTQKNIYCAQDDKDGLSPRRLRTTTVGDELKAVRSKAKVVSVSLKDRAAIMLGGHRADLALWMDDTTNRWTTSTYYNAKKTLPKWVAQENESLAAIPKKEFDVDSMPGAIRETELTLKLASAALKNEKLGRGEQTDLLAVSLSNHDFIGHKFGPDSTEIADLTKIEDQMLSKFLQDIQHEMKSWDDVVIAFTADHGTAPSTDKALEFHLDAGVIDMDLVTHKIDDELNKKYALKEKWVLGSHLFHFFLNHQLIDDYKMSLADVEADAKKIMLAENGVHSVFTESEYSKGVLPAGMLGEQIKNSYVPNQGGDLVLIPKPFWFVKGHHPTTHMTSWSYDRSVPLILLGKNFKPGVYSGAKVIDLAPTLTFVLGVLPPAASEGRVLSEILR